MKRERLLAEIADNPSIPTLPGVAFRVLEQANRPDCSVARLAALVRHDPGLTSKFLKIINSALFGLSRSVTSIDHAMQLLGLRRVRTLVLSLSLPTLQGKKVSGPRLKSYWKSSVVGAITARDLMRATGDPDPDVVMVAGLLRDIGMVVLEEVYPEAYPKFLDRPPIELIRGQCQLEEDQFGVHHAEVGAYLMGRWQLPQEICELILCHHHPQQAEKLEGIQKQRAGALFFASQLAHLEAAPQLSPLLGEILRLARDKFKMSLPQLEQFLEPLNRQFEELAAIMEVEVGSWQDYGSLLTHAAEQLSQLTVQVNLDNVRLSEEKTKAERERQEAQDALRVTEEQLRQAQKMNALGRLAGGIAHDFNNLLQIINGFSDLALSGLPQNNPLRGFIEAIAGAGTRAASLTRQLLAFSRKQMLATTVFDLNSSIAEMQKMLRRLIGEDIELITRLEPGLHTVRTDPGQMDQVIINLAINARDAMPKGGKLTIETKNTVLSQEASQVLSDVTAGPCALLEISDTGCGMDKETKSHLFEPFFTTKGLGKGTGLGLATVYGIIKQSHGHITARSELGKGTTFTILLPAATGPLDGRKQNMGATGSPPATETILLVEDEESVRNMVQKFLRMRGYNVLEAEHGAAAIQLSEQYPDSIHLLLTDVIMPQISGCELAQKLSKVRPNLKILYMSGYMDEAINRQGIVQMDTNFLQKPFTPRGLEEKVREVLCAPVQLPRRI